LRWLLEPVLGHSGFYVTLYMAVVFTALVCGLGPSILTSAVGFLGIVYWFVDTRYSLAVARRSDIHGIIGCLLVCTVLVALGETNRRKQLKLNESHENLEQRVMERTSDLSDTLATLASEVQVRERAEEELRNLSVRLMQVQDEERRRIARDLHDSAGQSLAAIKMSLASLRAIGDAVPNFQQFVDDLDALSDEALREIRTTSYLLHPPLLDEAGFASAAQWFVEGFSKRSGIHVQFGVSDDIGRLSGNVDLVLFRVLQEALTNVHRHSRCSAVGIGLTLEAREIVLQVSDNGRGFSEERLQSFRESKGNAGVGLAGMRERVRELGGRLEIQSDSSGTRLQARVPALGVQRAPAVHSQAISA
jgi:signal transduction histidine kinase